MNQYAYRPINMQATGQRIRELRLAKHFTVEQFGEIFSVSPQAVCKWQRGDALPGIENLLLLCDIYQIHVEDLIVREDVRSSAIFMKMKPLVYRIYCGWVL